MAGVSKTIAAIAVATDFRVLYWWRQQCKHISNGRLEIFKKIITLLTVTVLFLFTFFNLILDAPGSTPFYKFIFPPRFLTCFLRFWQQQNSKKGTVHNLFRYRLGCAIWLWNIQNMACSMLNLLMQSFDSFFFVAFILRQPKKKPCFLRICIFHFLFLVNGSMFFLRPTNGTN